MAGRRSSQSCKHSTGGIGDKTSLILAPLLACDGLWVPMISGRGLGITGGTLDKLESIPGFTCLDLSARGNAGTMNRSAALWPAETESLCPADRKLYALRDVTGTVPSIPLITASIMSKKLAEGLDRLVLDVKWGRGARLHENTRSGSPAGPFDGRYRQANGRPPPPLSTDMNQPLGRMVGNAVEVNEAVDVLKGEGPSDVVYLTLVLGAELLVLAKRQTTLEDATKRLQRAHPLARRP